MSAPTMRCDGISSRVVEDGRERDESRSKERRRSRDAAASPDSLRDRVDHLTVHFTKEDLG
jgi:hypothetical protein